MADQDVDFQDDEPEDYGYSEVQSAPPVVQTTNPLAIVSLAIAVVGLLACFCVGGFGTIILGIPAAITGFIARSQISQSGGAQKGMEMALIGLILGIVEVVLGIVLLIFFAGMVGLSLMQ